MPTSAPRPGFAHPGAVRLALACLAALAAAAAQGADAPAPAPAPAPYAVDRATLERIRDAALSGTWAYDHLADLTDLIGPRLSGSAQDAAAVAQMARVMRGLGARVTVQPRSRTGYAARNMPRSCSMPAKRLASRRSCT